MPDLIDEHEIVVLTEDVPAENTFGGEPKKDLCAGMKGTIVDVRAPQEEDIPPSYTVEFTTESGGRYPYHHHLATLHPDQVRPARKGEKAPAGAEA